MRDDRERLADVLAAIDRIRRHVQEDRARFDIDELLQSAVLHWIEIIGEAARGVSDKVRAAHPEVPWRVITGMRNRVSRGYFDIDLDVVWNTVTRDLPELQESVIRILAELAGYAQIADLVNTYESLPLGTTDASVVAIAERLGLTDVATLDVDDSWTAVNSRWSGRARGCADPSALKSVNDSALRGRAA